MALKKKIISKNGLPLEYHKISLVNIEPNHQITLLRESYLNEEARKYEKDYASGKINEPVFPYVDHEYIHLEYQELDGNIMELAYKLLKENNPELKDAEDV